MREECIEFPNDKGQRLRGILHLADGLPYLRTAVICLNTGLNDMVGWHRLQVKVARFLAVNGFTVLRFDNFGVGQSEGELSEGIVVELFAKIESGLWAADARSAVDYIESSLGCKTIVYLGYCGGALTAIHAAAKDCRIGGVVNIAAPVTLSNMEYLEKKDPWSVKKNVEEYKEKIFRPRSLMNFVTGKSDYEQVFTSIVHAVRHQISGRYQTKIDSLKLDVDIPNLNHSLYESFELFMKTRSRPILFYYPGLDNATWGLKKYFLPRYQDSPDWKKAGCEFMEIENANHIFSDEETQYRLKRDILHWLERHV